MPGTVDLRGGFVDADGNLDARVTAKLRSGTAGKGMTQPYKVKLSPKVGSSPGSRTGFGYVSLGCDEKDRPAEAKGLDTKDQKNSSTVLAEVIAICGSGLDDLNLKFNSVILSADLIVMNGENTQLVGKDRDTVSLEARELKLVGANQIKSKSTDPTLESGPVLRVSALRLSGEGTLAILSEGANAPVEKK